MRPTHLFVVSWTNLSRRGVGCKLEGPGQCSVPLKRARTPEQALATVIQDLRKKYGLSILVENPLVTRTVSEE